MVKRFLYIIPFLLVFSVLASCKARYLEVQAQLDQARNQKKELDQDIRKLKKENQAMSDSLLNLLKHHTAIMAVEEKFLKTLAQKKDFSDHEHSLYL